MDKLPKVLIVKDNDGFIKYVMSDISLQFAIVEHEYEPEEGSHQIYDITNAQQNNILAKDGDFSKLYKNVVDKDSIKSIEWLTD
jgi:hypothetical protein